MANNFGTLQSALVIQRALQLVFTKRPMLANLSLNLTDGKTNSPVALFNQTVNTRLLTVPAVGNFGDAAVERADTDVPVTLNQFKQVYHKITPQEYSGTNRNLVEESAEPMAVAIANYMVDAVAALWLPANFANQTIVAAAHSYTNTLLPVRQALVTRGVPENQRRFFSVNAGVYASLLGDALVVAALNNPSNGNAIQSGKLPVVAGFGIDEYPALPVTSNLIGFAGTPDSIAIVARVPEDPQKILPGAPFPGNLGIVTEPTTGFSVMVTEWIDPLTLNANVRLCWMYGVAIGNANNGQRLVSA